MAILCSLPRSKMDDASREARYFEQKAEHGALSNRIKLYERNSYIQTSFDSRSVGRRVSVTLDVVYGLNGNCGVLGATPGGASGYV